MYICGFHHYIITGICGMMPDRLFSKGFLRVLRFPPTVIRQMVKGLCNRIRIGSSALESVKRWRLSAIKSLNWIGLDIPVYRSIKIGLCFRVMMLKSRSRKFYANLEFQLLLLEQNAQQYVYHGISQKSTIYLT